MNFLSNGFGSRLDYQLVSRNINPHSSVTLLKQVFKQWNTHLDKQTLEITKKLIWVTKELNLQNLFCIPCICMFRNEHRWNLIYFAVAWHVIGSLQIKQTLLIFSGKEVGLVKSKSQVTKSWDKRWLYCYVRSPHLRHTGIKSQYHFLHFYVHNVYFKPTWDDLNSVPTINRNKKQDVTCRSKSIIGKLVDKSIVLYNCQ